MFTRCEPHVKRYWGWRGILAPPQGRRRVSKFLVKDIGVAVVPVSSFYHEAELGRSQVRLTFCKRDETLAAARRALAEIEIARRMSWLL
jgi:aspartate/methionine/tyrosine aminotransferase